MKSILIGLCVAACAAGRAGETAKGLEAQLDAKLAERHRRTVALAELHYASGDWKRAAELYEAARRIRDDDVQVLQQLMRLYRMRRDDRQLLSPLAALVRLQPTSIAWLRELGSCYYRLGQRERAEATWRRILDVYPSRSTALRYLAQAYQAHGLDEKAVAAWREAVEGSPRDEYLRLQLGEALSKAGRHLEALAAMAALRPGPSTSRTSRSSRVKHAAFFELDLPRSVRTTIERLLRAGKCSAADVAWAIAQVFEQSGEPKRAAAFYREVAAREPKTDRGKAASAKAKAIPPKP